MAAHKWYYAQPVEAAYRLFHYLESHLCDDTKQAYSTHDARQQRCVCLGDRNFALAGDNCDGRDAINLRGAGTSRFSCSAACGGDDQLNMEAAGWLTQRFATCNPPYEALFCS